MIELPVAEAFEVVLERFVLERRPAYQCSCKQNQLGAVLQTFVDWNLASFQILHFGSAAAVEWLLAC